MSSAKDSSIEYTVITTDAKTGAAQAQGMTNEMDKAISSAEKLLTTGDYAKIEIRQKYFDKKANRQVEGTLKTLEYKKPSSILPLVGLMLLAVAAGGGSFAGAYFLTRDKTPPAAEAEAAHGDAAPHGEKAPAAAH